jgi:hypothetical protein
MDRPGAALLCGIRFSPFSKRTNVSAMGIPLIPRLTSSTLPIQETYNPVEYGVLEIKPDFCDRHRPHPTRLASLKADPP